MGKWIDSGGTLNYPASWDRLDRLLQDIGHPREAEMLRKAVVLTTVRLPSTTTRIFKFHTENWAILSVIALAVSMSAAYLVRKF